MSRWLNHVAIAAPRNGTTSHTVDPSTGTVVAGASFTYTAGRFGVVVAYGAVTFTNPSGWTLAASAVNYGGLYVWYKASLAGGETVTTTTNASNYPVAVDFYEFPASSTWVNAVSASNVTGAGPSLAGLTGTNQVYASGGVDDSTTTTYTGSWASGTSLVSTCVTFSSTDGYLYSTAEIVDDTATSQSDAWTVSGGPNSERLMWAVQVPAGGPTGTLATTLDNSVLSASATETFAGVLAVTLDSAVLAAAGTVVSPVTGTLSATLDDSTLTASGTETISGTLAAALGDAVLAATGTSVSGITGTLATTLGDAVLTASGAEVLSGTFATTLDGAVLTAAGTVVLNVTGTLVTVLDDAGMVAVGTETFTGTLTVTLADAVLLAHGSTGAQVDITVTGSLDPRSWAGALTGRTKTGTLDPRRWEGTT